ncbi:MAG: hypothetical protein JSS65_03785 [Armatimonadetes bacterium]|nr:hypothetical protein [Armatimonadota bacterium]
MKLSVSTRASLKVTAVALLISAGLFLGYRAWGDVQLNGYTPTPIPPGDVTLVGIDSKGHYRIIVANEVAQLAEVTNSGAGKASSMDADSTNIRRIPIKEFLGSLRGDEKDLSWLVMSMNKMSQDDLPPTKVEWASADVEKALAGDPELKAKLESDLHLGLDGTPPDTLRLKTLLNGIVLDLPVKVQVPVEGIDKTLTATVQEAFMSRFAQDVQKKINEKFNPPQEMITAWYRDIALDVLNGKRAKEDIAAILKTKTSTSRQQALAEKPERLLQSSKVLLNDKQITGATVQSYQGQGNKTYANLTLRVTDDGRMRLWKYSHGRQEFHLMFVVNGVPLAAPKIDTELSSNEIVLRQLPNVELAQEAADFINKKGQESKP